MWITGVLGCWSAWSFTPTRFDTRCAREDSCCVSAIGALRNIDACFSWAEIAPAHIQSTKCIAIFTSNSHNDLRRIDLVHFEKPPGFPSVGKSIKYGFNPGTYTRWAPSDTRLGATLWRQRRRRADSAFCSGSGRRDVGAVLPS